MRETIKTYVPKFAQEILSVPYTHMFYRFNKILGVTINTMNAVSKNLHTLNRNEPGD